MKNKENLSSEASAFTKRINARSEKGFVPDLQNLKVETNCINLTLTEVDLYNLFEIFFPCWSATFHLL